MLPETKRKIQRIKATDYCDTSTLHAQNRANVCAHSPMILEQNATHDWFMHIISKPNPIAAKQLSNYYYLHFTLIILVRKQILFSKRPSSKALCTLCNCVTHGQLLFSFCVLCCANVWCLNLFFFGCCRVRMCVFNFFSLFRYLLVFLKLCKKRTLPFCSTRTLRDWWSFHFIFISPSFSIECVMICISTHNTMTCWGYFPCTAPFNDIVEFCSTGEDDDPHWLWFLCGIQIYK